MKIRMPSLRRQKYALGAVLMALAAAIPSLLPQQTYAAQVTDRSIQMTSSAADAAGVTYLISFDPADDVTVLKSIVVDFCSDSPILGETCTLPTDFTVGGTPSATVTGLTGTWTADDLNTGRTLTLTNATGDAANTGAVTIELSNVHNPSVVGTFYARILTYANSSGAGSAANYTAAAPGAHIDEGGVALSTAQQVSVSGTVQETLTFCVYGEAIADGCVADDAPALTLGNGSPIKVLTADSIDTADAFTQVSTNAGGGVAIRMKSSNACGGLSRDDGTTCDIAPANAGNATTPEAFTNGEAKFGVRALSDDADLDVSAPYTSGTDYGMAWDDNDVTGVTSPYGSQVAASTTVLDNANVTLTFAAGASNITPAGVYSATMTLIATGTY